MDVTIREIRNNEYHILNTFLYEAVFQEEGADLLPHSIINEPDLQIYIQEFGKADDTGIVAEKEGTIIGCVWARVFQGEQKGYGSIAPDVPELTISVLKEYRGKGTGTALMKKMLATLKQKGYSKASLSVQKKNFASQMYLGLGFEIVKDKGEEYIMVFHLRR